MNVDSGKCRCGGSKGCGHEMCTGCAWEEGFDEVRVVNGASEAYGPYAGFIRERVESCADYLRRINGQLARRPSRHYVAEKAQMLRDAAGRLVVGCHDVEGWLRACGEKVRREVNGDTLIEECALLAGHDGEHRGEAPRTALEVARDLADKVAESSLGVADHLGWIMHDPGRLGDRDDLEALGRGYGELRRVVDRLSPALAALRLAHERPEVPAWLDEELASIGRRSDGPHPDELVCMECEFEATSIENLAEHCREAGH